MVCEGIRRDLHLQTRIAKHLEVSSDTRVVNEYCIVNSPFHDGPNNCAEYDLNGQRPSRVNIA